MKRLRAGLSGLMRPKYEPTLVVREVTRRSDPGESILSARIVWSPHEWTVQYRVRGSDISPGDETLLAATLQPAMRMTPTPALILPGRVSARLWQALPAIQALWGKWDPTYRTVEVRVHKGDYPGTRPRGVGCFFSAGVDSFYSVLRAPEEIAHLILVRGFDMLPDKQELWQRVSASVRAAAAELGKPLIEVETDLRLFSDHFVPWKMYYGSGLASVAHLLSRTLREVRIPSGSWPNTPEPWGSHPRLDPLWSSHALSVVWDGLSRRIDKVRAIAHNPIVQKYLRVCWQNTDGAYNCCRCEKCLRTMVAFDIAGCLEQVKTFDRPLTAQAIDELPTPHLDQSFLHEELLAALEERGLKPDIADAERRLLRRIEAQA